MWFVHKYLWKMKVPLKIKIFMWFVHQKEILTKDNLVKRNWQGSSKCCFCDHEETVQHLFIQCPFAKIVWSIVRMALNISPPLNINNLFGTWLNGLPKTEKVHIRVGTYAISWAIWHVRNDFIFNKSHFPLFFYRLFLWLSIGSVYGPISNLRSAVRTWIFGATVWQR
jgi:hypothetical protein